MIYEETGIKCLKRLKIRKKEESFMKNIYKYLSIFALAGMVGLQSVNAVQVEACKENEEIHTNYYMFLESDPVTGLKEFLADATETQPKSMYTGADKYNNIKQANYLNEGNVKIVASGTTADGDNDKTWTVAEFWRRYYSGRSAQDSNGLYTSGSSHYFYHTKWYVYEDENFGKGELKNHSDATENNALMSYISDKFSTLEGTELVTTGTMLPKTTIKRPDTLFSTSDDTNLWHIIRAYSSPSVPAGVPLNGNRVVYAPAVYWVRWCGPKSGTTPSTKKTITYDANTTDKVTGLPANQEFDQECVDLATSRPTRTGWTFLGWAKSATSTGADYIPGQKYCGDSVTLYAVWVKNQTGPFTITYDANGGKDAPAAQSGQSGECLTISTQKPTLSGNTFVGWSTNAKSAVPEDIYAPGKQYCGEAGSITLYAIYRADTGVSAHLIAYGSIAAASIVALVIAKKKNLFKQI